MLLDEIDWLLDPDVSDPWPRHTQHSGASIAVRAGWLARAGGIPAIPLAEDRQFFARLRGMDARIRHSRDVVVTVSGRTVGRAKGGMADTIARRMRQPDQWLDECLEPANDHAVRALLRASARRLWAGATGNKSVTAIANALRLPAATVSRTLESETFGHGWNKLESASPAIQRRIVPVRELEWQMVRARKIVDDIRASGCVNAPIHRGDSASFAFA
jgi:hypothetical protein